MDLVARVLLLTAGVKVLLVTNKPLVSSAIYTIGHVAAGFAFQRPTREVLIGGAIAWVISTIYFFLMNRAKGVLWWLLLFAGAAIVIAPEFLQAALEE